MEWQMSVYVRCSLQFLICGQRTACRYFNNEALERRNYADVSIPGVAALQRRTHLVLETPRDAAVPGRAPGV